MTLFVCRYILATDVVSWCLLSYAAFWFYAYTAVAESFVPTGGHGGARRKVAKERTPPWLHPDARPAKRAKLEQSVQRAMG